MAQNENYSQVDLRVGTEEQFNAKVGTLPAGTLFGVTDSTVSKADLSTDLKNEINGKINKPANPTSDSAVVINSSGTVSTKLLSDIAGKSEVYVGTPDPTGGEILWIDPNGTSSGGGSGGGKLYKHYTLLVAFAGQATLNLYVYSISSISKAYDAVSAIPLYFISGIYKDPSNYFVITKIIRNDTKLKVYYLSSTNNTLEIEQDFKIVTDNLTEL